MGAPVPGARRVLRRRNCESASSLTWLDSETERIYWPRPVFSHVECARHCLLCPLCDSTNTVSMDVQSRAELSARLYSICSWCAELIDRSNVNNRGDVSRQETSLCICPSSMRSGWKYLASRTSVILGGDWRIGHQRGVLEDQHAISHTAQYIFETPCSRNVSRRRAAQESLSTPQRERISTPIICRARCSSDLFPTVRRRK